MNERVTTKKGVYCGWRAAERAMNRGISWGSLPENSVLGFIEIEDAIGHYYRANDKCHVVYLSK